MALGSTQPLIEMRTRSISWGKGGRCVGLTNFCAVIMKSGNLNFLEPSRSLQTCNGTALPFRTYRNYGFCQDRGTQPSLKSCQSLSASRSSQLLTGPEDASSLPRQADSGSCKQPVTHSPYCVIKNQLYRISSRNIVQG